MIATSEYVCFWKCVTEEGRPALNVGSICLWTEQKGGEELSTNIQVSASWLQTQRDQPPHALSVVPFPSWAIEALKPWANASPSFLSCFLSGTLSQEWEKSHDNRAHFILTIL